MRKLGTGTAEVGGWSTRELLTILDGLNGLEVIGADVGTYAVFWFPLTNVLIPCTHAYRFTLAVEVAPIYDNRGETTVLAAAEVVNSLVTLMVDRPVKP